MKVLSQRRKRKSEKTADSSSPLAPQDDVAQDSSTPRKGPRGKAAVEGAARASRSASPTVKRRKVATEAAEAARLVRGQLGRILVEPSQSKKAQEGESRLERILTCVAEQAEQGDHRAREWVSERYCGRPTPAVEASGPQGGPAVFIVFDIPAPERERFEASREQPEAHGKKEKKE